MNFAFLKQSLTVMGLVAVVSFPSFAMDEQEEEPSSSKISHYRRVAAPLFDLANELNSLNAKIEGLQFALKGFTSKTGLTVNHLLGEPLCEKIERLKGTSLDLSQDAASLGERVNGVRSEKIKDENELIQKINEATLEEEIKSIREDICNAVTRENIDEKFLDKMAEHLPDVVAKLRASDSQPRNPSSDEPRFNVRNIYFTTIREGAKTLGITNPMTWDFFEDTKIRGKLLSDMKKLNENIQLRTAELRKLSKGQSEGFKEILGKAGNDL
jgi:hypothetical protein